MRLIWTAVILIIALAAAPAFTQLARADTSLNAIGDIGCKSDAKKNLNNLAAEKKPVLVAGDARYKCSVSEIKPLWDKISVKHGCYGNHDVESSTSKSFYKDIMGLGPNGWFSWKIADIAIIGMNQYANYKVNSAQYNYTLQKIDQFDNRPDINWIIICIHEPINTPSCDHGPADTFRNIYYPIFDKIQNIILIQAHNHCVGFGYVAGINQAICGGGGQNQDVKGALNGFEYLSLKMGYCAFSFGDTTAVVQHRGVDNKILKEFPFYN